MPLDATGAYVPDLQPPTPASIGVAPTAAAPLQPVVADPNARPLVYSPMQTPAPAIPVPVAAPALAPPAPVAAPQIPAPSAPPAPTAPRAPAADPLQGIKDATAQQAGAEDDLGQAQKEQDDAVAQGRADQRVQHQMDAVEVQDTIARQNAAAQVAHEQTQRALIEARDSKIPDFFAGDEGHQAMTALGVALSGVGAGLLGSTNNGAATIAQNNIDFYYKRQKDKIDNLYKYAESMGHAEDSLRTQHASELAALQIQHGATNLAMADHIDEVTAASQGRVDISKANAMKAKLVLDGREAVLRGQQTLAQIALTKSEIAKNYAEAARQKTAAANDKSVKETSAEFDKDEGRLLGTSRAPGLVAQQRAIRELGNTLREAAASGDPERIKAAVIQNKEKIARLNTGAAPSHEQMKLLDGLQGSPAEISEKLNSLFGTPTASNQTVKGLMDLVDQSDEGALRQIDQARGSAVQKYLGPNGIARTPAQRQHALGRIGGVFGETTTRTPQGEVPRYQEGGANATPAQAQGPAVGTVVKQGGKSYQFRGGDPKDAKNYAEVR